MNNINNNKTTLLYNSVCLYVVFLFCISFESSAQKNLWQNDNQNIYYIGGKVGIGLTDPTAILEIESKTNNPDLLKLNNSTFNNLKLRTASNDPSTYAFLASRKSKGSIKQPVQVEANETILKVIAAPQIAADYRDAAGIVLTTASDFKTSNYSTNISFNSCSGTSQKQRLLVTSDGKVGIGNSTPIYSLDVSGALNVSRLLIEGAEFVPPLPGNSLWTATSEGLHYANQVSVGSSSVSENAQLTVAGSIRARALKTSVEAGADFVFDEDYILQDLSQLEAFIRKNKHLPEIASASEMKAQGIDLTLFSIQLLQKVEELIRYKIALHNELEKQASQLELLGQIKMKLERLELNQK